MQSMITAMDEYGPVEIINHTNQIKDRSRVNENNSQRSYLIKQVLKFQ